MKLINNYVLGNELAEKAGYNTANVSNVYREITQLNDQQDIIRLGNCIFLKKQSIYYPKFIQKHLNTHKFTSIKNGAPLSYILEEFDVNREAFLESMKDYILDIKTISNKDIIEFTDEFVNKTKGKVLVTINQNDINECIDDKLIDGFIKIKRKYLVWY